MIKPTTLAAAVLIALPAVAWAQSQPSSDWNGNFQFRGDRTGALLQADMIERASEGYYEQWSQTNVFYTTSNVGAITNTTVEGDNNAVNTGNSNCGDVSGSINTGSSHSDTHSNGGGCD